MVSNCGGAFDGTGSPGAPDGATMIGNVEAGGLGGGGGFGPVGTTAGVEGAT